MDNITRQKFSDIKQKYNDTWDYNNAIIELIKHNIHNLVSEDSEFANEYISFVQEIVDCSERTFLWERVYPKDYPVSSRWNSVSRITGLPAVFVDRDDTRILVRTGELIDDLCPGGFEFINKTNDEYEILSKHSPGDHIYVAFDEESFMIHARKMESIDHVKPNSIESIRKLMKRYKKIYEILK
jgi:hypothetical protein